MCKRWDTPLILAKLARLDSGGQIVTRPLNSLREIFLWWHPGTNASLEQRLAALDLILTREPEVGWALLAKLLPHTTSSVSNPTAKPRWRDFGDLPDDAYTRRGQFTYASEMSGSCASGGEMLLDGTAGWHGCASCLGDCWSHTACVCGDHHASGRQRACLSTPMVLVREGLR